MKEPVFRKTSMDKISSPEQLDDYIRVTTPSLWVTIAAIIILLISLIVWGAVGSLPTAITVNGIAQNGVVTCYLTPEQAGEISSETAVSAGNIPGSVEQISSLPLSAAEVKNALASDYLFQAVNVTDFTVPVTVSAQGIHDGIVSVRFTVSSVRPIDFLLN